MTKFGLHIESELTKIDDKGKLVNDLDSLLSQDEKIRSGHRLVGNMPGMDTIIVDE